MKGLKHICAGLLLVSSSVLAEGIQSIRIFHNDAIGVVQDVRVPEGVVLYIHNLDAMEHSEKKLTAVVKNKVNSQEKKGAAKEAYMQAFSDVLNSDAWGNLYPEIVASTEPQEKAVRYGIKKIPAILFNEKSIIYGVTSMKEAIQIYNQNGGGR